MNTLECVGCPRDMGLAQGRAWRGTVRDRVARAGGAVRRWPSRLLRLTSGPALGTGPGLAIARHYPHLLERIEGIAKGAELPLDALVGLTTRVWDAAEAFAGAAPQESGGDPVVVRTLARAVAPGSRWRLRRSRPDVGFASVEVTLPWLASSLAGVNEAGIAVAACSAACLPDDDVVRERLASAPALLLVQECLQRFGNLEGCLDWCLNRPVDGQLQLVIADAAGEVASVGIAGSERHVSRRSDELVVAGGHASLRAELQKAYREGGKLVPEDWARSVGAESCVLLSPRDRGLAVLPGTLAASV